MRLASFITQWKKQRAKIVFTRDYPHLARFQIGEWTYGCPDVRRWQDDCTLSIGKFCSIADNVTILLGGEHRTNWATTYPFAELFPNADEFPRIGLHKGDVAIGHDVWIGHGATILSGVTIGNGAVIGAGSLVTKNVAAYSIIGGNPAALIRYRFDETTIKSLQELKWWTWSDAVIRDRLYLILSENVEALLAICSSSAADAKTGML